jgi:hypothetical protein
LSIHWPERSASAPRQASARPPSHRRYERCRGAGRFQGKVSRIYFRADAGFANAEVYEYLEGGGIKYVIRLPANRVLQERIGHLLTRPVGRPPNEVRRSYANFTHQAGTWTKPRRVVAKVEWHPGELYTRVGFIVTNMPGRPQMSSPSTTSAGPASSGSRRARERSDGCGSRAALSPPTHPPHARNLGNFLRTLATPETIKDWSLTSLKEPFAKRSDP